MTIVDASNLERNLYLTTQVLELGVPVVVALNMIDVAEGQGLKIDAEQLSQQLGVPVVPIQANKGKGLDELKAGHRGRRWTQPHAAERPAFPRAFEARSRATLRATARRQEPPFLVRRLLLDVGGYTETRLTEQVRRRLWPTQCRRPGSGWPQAGCPVPAVEARTRYGWIRQATAGCIAAPGTAARHAGPTASTAS